MAARSLADLMLSFGLVSIPVRLYSAQSAQDGVSFNLIHEKCGSRVKQRLFCAKEGVEVERSELVKGYEIAKDQYVLFTADEYKQFEDKATHTIDIIGFLPEGAVDPIYYDKAYYLAPDSRGARPFALLIEGMRKTGRVALARWSRSGKTYTVQVRVHPDGALVVQQLFYGYEVKPVSEIPLVTADVKPAELELATTLIDQIAIDHFDPSAYGDDFKARVEAAVQRKIEGKEIVETAETAAAGATVIDLMEALRASLRDKAPDAAAPATAAKAGKPAKARKPPARSPSLKPAPAKKTAQKK